MRYLTAGESHGPRLTAIIEGVPAGLPLTAEDINGDLKRRQGGYGRGGRMKIESDKVEITSGVRHGKTNLMLRLLKQLYPSMPSRVWNLVLVSKMATSRALK